MDMFKDTHVIKMWQASFLLLIWESVEDCVFVQGFDGQIIADWLEGNQGAVVTSPCGDPLSQVAQVGSQEAPGHCASALTQVVMAHQRWTVVLS